MIKMIFASYDKNRNLPNIHQTNGVHKPCDTTVYASYSFFARCFFFGRKKQSIEINHSFYWSMLHFRMVQSYHYFIDFLYFCLLLLFFLLLLFPFFLVHCQRFLLKDVYITRFSADGKLFRPTFINLPVSWIQSLHCTLPTYLSPLAAPLE